MSPAFYDASLPSPPRLFAPSSQTSSSTSSLPTLAVVLGLTSGLLVISGVAGICIYIFRGRLITTEPLPEAKEVGLHNGAGIVDRLSIPDGEEYQTRTFTTPEMPALRPLLLGTASAISKKSPYKELLLPRLQNERRVKSYQSISRPDANSYRHSQPLHPSAMKRMSFPFGTSASKPLPKAPALTVSSSCPASLSQITAAANDSAITSSVINRPSSDQCETVLKDTESTERLSRRQHFSLILADESMSSTSSENSVSSSSSGHSLDYYFKNPSGDLFYEPETTSASASTPRSASDVFEDEDASCSSFDGLSLKTERQEKPQISISAAAGSESSTATPKTPTTTLRSCARASFRALPLSKRPPGVTARRKRIAALSLSSATKFHNAVTAAYKLRTQAAAFFPSSVRVHNVPRATALATISKKQTVNGKASTSNKSSKPKTKPRPKLESNKPVSQRRNRTTHISTHQSKKKSSRTRQPFGLLTNVQVPLEPQAQQESKPSPAPALLLNGMPTDTGQCNASAALNRRSPSPPIDRALLNVRWAPKPTMRPFAITVLVKGHSSDPAAYTTGLRSLEIRTHMENTLEDLRGAVEKALGYRPYLRGMVRVGAREMFVPLLREVFFQQWVAERVREGGEAVIDAWRRDY
ncbi:hypothetical protein DFH11DRAFT_866716 [Phellopilus nigrolimitatus]|nr:hypothetical protein DFH11DRAFT_866716 [Phellopilus nigrolimitatus]